MKAAIAITFIFLVSCASPIDRRKVVERHNVTICATDSLSPAQVGNGHFAFGMDITGLQTFVPFNTLADWSWHSFPKDGAAMSQEYRGVPVEAWGRTVPMEFPDSSRPDISAWLACNPHRFNLGRVGFILMKEDGTAAVEEDLEDAVHHALVAQVGAPADDVGEVVGDEYGGVAVALVAWVTGQGDDAVVRDADAAAQVEFAQAGGSI